MKRIIFYCILKPLILVDRSLRKRGLKPDTWYWADEIAVDWGYFA